MSGVENDERDTFRARDYFGSERRSTHSTQHDSSQTARAELIAQRHDFI
jgi:hypothetical protein